MPRDGELLENTSGARPLVNAVSTMRRRRRALSWQESGKGGANVRLWVLSGAKFGDSHRGNVHILHPMEWGDASGPARTFLETME